MRLAAVLVVLLLAGAIRAEQSAPSGGDTESNTDLAKKTQNPVADLISVPFQNNFNFNTGPEKRSVWILNIQPVIPIKLTDDWNLITRTIVPIINQPPLAPGVDQATGMGDINPSFFLSPSGSTEFIWGIGPTFTFPTASNLYTQVVYCLDRVPAVVKAKPALAKVEPFKTVLSGNREAIARLPMADLVKILAATLSGMSVDEFETEVKNWLATARDPRWKRPYTELTYLPMIELLKYLRANGFKTYIVTGGGQDFVRVYAEQVYGIPPEQVVGTAGGTTFGYRKDGKPFLTKEPKLLLNDDNAGKPEGIHLMIGRRPDAAFGNSTDDRQMLEYTTAGDGERLAMLVLHDDAKREYAYGPALGLPDTRIGTFPQALYDEAKKKGWTVISMQKDWKRIFSFDE
jgi:haloacid dehalogenase-like hydrolase